MSKAYRIRISSELFFHALAFPEGVKLLDASLPHPADGSVIELLIEHEDLPERPLFRIPVITPQITEVGPRPAEYLAFDWNLPASEVEGE